MKQLRKLGYHVTAEYVDCDYANKGRHLPFGMAFVLRKGGEFINHHTTSNGAWQWAKRLTESTA